MARNTIEVEALDWETEFLPFFADWWDPGQHGAVIAPTGAGKTNFVGGILEYARKYVITLDAKGGDDTLDAFHWPRLEKWPGKKKFLQMIDKNEEQGLASRYVVGARAVTDAQFERLIDTLDLAMSDAYELGDLTIYADELMILTDPRQFRLRPRVDKILIAARNRGISFVGSFQSPSWVTPQAARQATWVAVSYTRDTDAVNRLAEILGHDKAAIRAAIEGLDPFAWIVVGKNPREPLRVTIPTLVGHPK